MEMGKQQQQQLRREREKEDAVHGGRIKKKAVYTLSAAIHNIRPLPSLSRPNFPILIWQGSHF